MSTTAGTHSSVVQSRAIGQIGTIVRVVLGVALLGLAIVGLPPIGHILDWWQILIGLAALPAMAALVQVARLAFKPQQLRATGPVATCVNCAVLTALLLIPPTRDATMVFLGAALLVAAYRGYAGCETLAVSNWLLGRNDQVGCLLLSPIDRLEAAHGSGYGDS
jgi:CDP-diglyceride synthetase